MIGLKGIIWQSLAGTRFLGAVMVVAMLFCPLVAGAQQFSIEQQSDSLWTLSLSHNGTVTDTWQLPYPVFRFATADINGDGSPDAVVGVYKSSRYFKQPSRRVFIFKDFDGDIRPLWLGSRLGGELVDFDVDGNKVRAIERSSKGYEVSYYAWQGFGLGYESHVASCGTIDQCYYYLPTIKPKSR